MMVHNRHIAVSNTVPDVRVWAWRGGAVGLMIAVLVIAAVGRPTPPPPAGLQLLRTIPAGPYSPAGAYVGPLATNVDPPGVILREGVPVDYYPGRGYQRNAVTIEQYGLAAFGRFVAFHRPADRVAAVRAADWLLGAQQRDGTWLYHFRFTLEGHLLRPPWISALAQGQALSLLERVYRATGRRRYLLGALRALRPLERAPLRRCYHGDCRHPIYEEYPTHPPANVLNGFMFTLLGLYDLSSVAPRSPAGAMYRAGRRTLLAALPSYDAGGLPRYDQLAPGIADQSYQAVHIYLLRALNSIAPSPELRFYAARWLHNIAAAPPDPTEG